ncbi:MAG: MFS transporter [Planctomycetaceae bacterium]|nr:MFS transporter [Planctomycetaceae bacterium]
MLLIAAAATFMSAPGQSYSVAAFIEGMLQDLKLSRTEFSTAYGLATLIGGLTLPGIGRLLDRWGARIALPLIATLLGAACVWMSYVTTAIGLFFGFAAIRCLGQGSLTLISSWLVGEWYERRRGMAMGLVGLGGTASVMLVPQINHLLIEHLTWRTAWVVLAAAVWVVLVIPGAFLVRNRPEDIGLLPDGVVPATPPEPHAAHHVHYVEAAPTNEEPAAENAPAVEDDDEVEHVFTAGEAFRTATFWKLLAVVCTSSLVGTGLVFHQVSLLGSRGVGHRAALGVLGVHAFVATFSSVLGGWLTDRMRPRTLLAISMLFMSLALLLLINLPSPEWAVLYGALLGLHGGIIRSTGTVIWVNYFGRPHQGAVRGLALSAMIIAAAAGPLPIAVAQDTLGSPSVALSLFLILPASAAFLVWTARRPVPIALTAEPAAA